MKASQNWDPILGVLMLLIMVYWSLHRVMQSTIWILWEAPILSLAML